MVLGASTEEGETMSDEDFEACLKKLGKEDADPNLIEQFRTLLESNIGDNILETWFVACLSEKYYPSSNEKAGRL